MSLNVYLFTDVDGKKIELRTCDGADGALTHRRSLERKAKKTVVSWVHMGGDNPYPVK
jgi:hypothetical protein